MGAKPRKIKAKRCGAPKGGGGGEEERRRCVFPWKSVGYRANFVSIGCAKKVIDILEGQALQWWEGRGVRRSAAPKQQQSANCSKQATRKAATSSRIRSSTNHNPETVRAKWCGSRRWEGVFTWNFVRLCSRLFFFWSPVKFATIGL